MMNYNLYKLKINEEKLNENSFKENNNSIYLNSILTQSKENTSQVILERNISHIKFAMLYPSRRFLHLVRSYSRKESNEIKKVTKKAEENQVNETKKQFKGILKNLNKLSTKNKAMPNFKVIETDNKEVNEILITSQKLGHLSDHVSEFNFNL